MSSRHRGPLPLALAALTLVALAQGCSKSDNNPAAPPPPTGPTFNFTFTSTNESHEFVFTDVGSWGYHCSAHSVCCGMNGTVIVDPAQTSTLANVSVGSGGNVFSPASVTIKPGGKVVWTLATGGLLNHTVTR